MRALLVSANRTSILNLPNSVIIEISKYVEDNEAFNMAKSHTVFNDSLKFAVFGPISIQEEEKHLARYDDNDNVNERNINGNIHNGNLPVHLFDFPGMATKTLHKHSVRLKCKWNDEDWTINNMSQLIILKDANPRGHFEPKKVITRRRYFHHDWTDLEMTFRMDDETSTYSLWYTNGGLGEHPLRIKQLRIQYLLFDERLLCQQFTCILRNHNNISRDIFPFCLKIMNSLVSFLYHHHQHYNKLELSYSLRDIGFDSVNETEMKSLIRLIEIIKHFQELNRSLS